MSKLILGTANFGQEYNGHKVEEPQKILEYALENGIEYIDTAEAYSNYDILLPYSDKFKIITKTKGHIDERFYITLAHGTEYMNNKIEGISIYEPWEMFWAINRFKIKYIQVPYSIFNQSFGQLEEKTFIKVFLRSVFLKGYLIKTKLHEEILRKYRMSNVEAALLFSLNKGDCVVGVDNVEQLKELIQISKQKAPDGLIEELKQKYGHTKLSLEGT